MSTQETTDLKRFIGGAMGLIILLVGTVWALTWNDQRIRVNDHETRLRQTEKTVSDGCTRMTVIETQMTTINKNLDEIKTAVTSSSHKR